MATFSRSRRLFSVVLLALAMLVVGAFSATATPLTTDADPMAYCTAQHVTDAYSMDQVAEVTGDSSGQSVDSSVVEQAVTDYGGYMETHVRMQHADDPFDETHDLLRSLNVEGAFLLMCKRQPGGLTEEQAEAEERLDDILMEIANGSIALMDEADQAEAESRPDLDPDQLVQAAPRVFGGSRYRREDRGLC